MDRIFHALSDRTRRAILRDVARRPKTVGELARPHKVSLAAVSKHLKVLDAAGLITRDKQGSYQWVQLNVDALRAAERWLAYYQRFWNEKLDTLAAYLEGEDDEA